MYIAYLCSRERPGGYTGASSTGPYLPCDCWMGAAGGRRRLTQPPLFPSVRQPPAEDFADVRGWPAGELGQDAHNRWPRGDHDDRSRPPVSEDRADFLNPNLRRVPVVNLWG